MRKEFVWTIIFMFLMSCGDSQVKVTEYYKDGAKFEKWVDKNGKEDGPAIMFFPNGSIKRIMLYENGYVKGKVAEYYENGHMKYLYGFSNSALNGHFYGFHDNKKLKEISYYKNDTIYYKKRFDSVGVLVEEYKKLEVIQISKNIIAADTFKAYVDIKYKNDFNIYKYLNVNSYSFDLKNKIVKNDIGILEDKSNNRILIMVIPKLNGKHFFSGDITWKNKIHNKLYVEHFDGKFECK